MSVILVSFIFTLLIALQPDRLEFSPIEHGVHRDTHESIHFEGADIPINDAAVILVKIGLDALQPEERRVAALHQLGAVTGTAAGEALFPELVRAFLREPQAAIRLEILLGLMLMEDPRVPGLLQHVLETSDDVTLRGAAAVGLMRWNVADGIDELLDRLEQPPGPQIGSMSLAATVFDAFLKCNRTRNWGFPGDELMHEIQTTAGGDEFAAAAIARTWISEWFEDHRERFAEIPEAWRDAWRDAIAVDPPTEERAGQSIPEEPLEAPAAPGNIPENTPDRMIDSYRPAEPPGHVSPDNDHEPIQPHESPATPPTPARDTRDIHLDQPSVLHDSDASPPTELDASRPSGSWRWIVGATLVVAVLVAAGWVRGGGARVP